jgi:hypothetical protein
MHCSEVGEFYYQLGQLKNKNKNWNFVTIWYILWPFGIFCGHLVYCEAIWYILWPCGIFCGHVAYFVANWYILYTLIDRWQRAALRHHLRPLAAGANFTKLRCGRKSFRTNFYPTILEKRFVQKII